MKAENKKVRQFNVMLTENEHRGLTALSESEGISAAQVIRLSLRARIAMSEGQPVCSNGQSCFMPQMHLRSVPK